MSTPTGLVSPVGSEQFPWVETCEPGGMSGATGIANYGYWFRVSVRRPITVTQMTISVGTASGEAVLAIYQSDGTTLTRLATTGAFTVVGSGGATQTVALGSSVHLVPGVSYYFALSIDNATASFNRLTSNVAIGGIRSRWMQKSSSHPLPASVALSALSALNTVYWILAD